MNRVDLHRSAARLAALAALLPAALHAAPPDVKWLLPAGGQAGQTVEVKVGGTLGAAPVQLWSDRPGIVLDAPAEAKNSVRLTIAADASPGLYRVRFYNAEGASTPRAFVVGALAEVNEKEPNDRPDAPQAIATLPVVVNGTLAKSGDVDLYAADLKKGQTLVASVLANEGLGSPMDAVLQIVSSNGFVLAQNNDDRGLDPQLAWTAPADGRYAVRLFAFPSEPNSSIRLSGSPEYVYRLTLTTGPFADHAVPLAVTAGASTEVALRGWNLPDDGLSLPVGAAAADSTSVLHAPGLANTVTVAVEAHATQSEPATADPAKPLSITPPMTVSGHIEQPRVADVYRVDAKKGKKLRLVVQARQLGSPLDPVLRVTDAAGKVLQENDDQSRERLDAELTFTPPADGEYRVEIRDLNGNAGWRYYYRLTAAAPQPDFGLSVAADNFTLKAGTPLEIPVTVAREFGLAAEIEIQADDLPEGVTAAAVVSQPKGDTAKAVALKLESTRTEPFSGTFRIVGRTADESKREHDATTGSGIPLWLTATPAPAETPKK